MVYAPRPLEKYAYLERTASVKKQFLSAFALLTGTTKGLSLYEPFSQYPICFDSNEDILVSLGHEGYLDLLIDTIAPMSPFYYPSYDPLQEGRQDFLQSGFGLSENEQEFYYDIGGRLFVAGFAFCRTPDDVKDDLDKSGLKSGPWMLDQMHFFSRGKFKTYLCDHRNPAGIDRIQTLLSMVREVNEAHHLDDYDKESLFSNKMDYFDDVYVLNSPTQEIIQPVPLPKL